MRPLLAALALALGGCAIPWHPFGTPISKAEKAQARVEQATIPVTTALVEEVHKTSLAIDAALAGKPNALETAKGHSRVAVTLADQLYGPPTVINETKWADLISRQTSLDATVRQLADKENARRLAEIGKLSGKLDKTEQARDDADKRAVKAAGELQAFKDRVVFWCWVVGALFVLYFLGQILQFAAHFSPAFEGAANLVNTFVSPALHLGFSKARKALAAVTE